MSISTSANTFPPKLKPSIHGQGWSARQRRCGGERSPSLSRPTSASPGPHFLGQVCITKRFPRPCSELEKVVWELEKSPDTISTSTKRHEPPSERLSPRCTAREAATRREAAAQGTTRTKGVAACVLARVLRVLRVLVLRVLRVCVCFCVPLYLRHARVRVLWRALVLVRELRHARVRALVRAACAACASTRAAFLVPPNSWQPRDTTSACTCSTCTPDMIQTIVGAIASVL